MNETKWEYEIRFEEWFRKQHMPKKEDIPEYWFKMWAHNIWLECRKDCIEELIEKTKEEEHTLSFRLKILTEMVKSPSSSSSLKAGVSEGAD